MSEANTEDASKNRRRDDFVQRLSIILVVGAFIGGFLVLLDIRFVIELWGQQIMVGTDDGFSPEVKGVVLQSMLITGFAAVVAFWLGASKQGQESQQSVSKIAEAAAPAQAKAVAAARAPAPTDPVLPAPAPDPDAVTPAAKNPVTGNVPAAEAVEPPQEKPT